MTARFGSNCIREWSTLVSSHVPTTNGLILGQKRYFGMKTVRAYLRKKQREQETAKKEAEIENQILEERKYEWQPNETTYLGEQINVPSIPLHFNSNDIKITMNAIDNNNESDINNHPFHIYSAFVIGYSYLFLLSFFFCFFFIVW